MQSLSGSTQILQMMNEQMDISQIKQVLNNFNKEQMKQGIKEDAVSRNLILFSKDLLNIGNNSNYACAYCAWNP